MAAGSQNRGKDFYSCFCSFHGQSYHNFLYIHPFLVFYGKKKIWCVFLCAGGAEQPEPQLEEVHRSTADLLLLRYGKTFEGFTNHDLSSPITTNQIFIGFIKSFPSSADGLFRPRQWRVSWFDWFFHNKSLGIDESWWWLTSEFSKSKTWKFICFCLPVVIKLYTLQSFRWNLTASTQRNRRRRKATRILGLCQWRAVRYGLQELRIVFIRFYKNTCDCISIENCVVFVS